MHVDPQQFVREVGTLLGWYYLLVAAMNVFAAARVGRRGGYVRAAVWLIVGGGFTGLWAAMQAKERCPSADIVLIEQTFVKRYQPGTLILAG